MVVVQSRSAPRAAAAPRAPVVGGWELIAPLGSGAWTHVFKARPTIAPKGVDGDYAVKVLRPEHAGEAQAVAMLQHEAYVLRQASHPNLTTLLAAGLERPPMFLVLPHHSGRSLRQKLARRERLALPQKIWIVRQTAEAVLALHRAGWLHGDINSGNILVAPTGHATLIDLGLARRLTGEAQEVKVLQGTPAYMAPECFQGQYPLTAAVDVYSLGVVLYELLLGARPFQDDDPLELVTNHLETPPPDLRQRLPQLPTRAARLVRRMLAKQPLRRPCMEELIETLMALEIDTFDERQPVLPLAA